MRQSSITRETAETKINLTLTLDAKGESDIKTGCGFLDHMLTLFARHGHFDLQLSCIGDTDVDFHHTTEDIGICLGKAFAEALCDKKGINRYGDIILPMDESLILCALDVSGRGGAFCDFDIPSRRVGSFDTELCEEFFIAFALNAGVTLHVRQICGRNSHHIIEGAFKAFARALAKAVEINEKYSTEIPSTKGTL